jgi:hypothetical protein
MKYIDFITKSKIGDTGIIINAPAEIESEFLKAGYKNAFSSAKSSATIIFIKDSTEFNRIVPEAINHIENDSKFWICYPKGTSKVKTDINRDILWKLFGPFGLRPVTMISFDNVWSAMRFRPNDKVKSKEK